jgi:hypothetical protein
MLLDDIGIHLERNGFGLLNTDIFLGNLPDTVPDTCIGLFEYAGSPASMASGGVAAERPRVQVVVRDTGYRNARRTAESIYQLLNGAGDITINGTNYMWIEAFSPPFYLARDQAGRIKIVCNYEVTKALSAEEES